jgi:hypothetical protein
MAYDDHRRRMVLFGGQGGQGPSFPTNFNDTWEYDGNDWTSIPTVHSPVAQNALSMTYDSCRQKTVLFDRQGATWEYAGGDWTMVNTSTAPPGRALAAMVFDPLRCRVVMFGGLPQTGPLNALSDTWEYDGFNWIHINPGISPPGRWAHAMAYDTNRGRAVLFGGYGPSYPTGRDTNDTWEFDGNTWLQVFPAHSPASAEQVGMAYDPTRAGMVMFGGWGSPAQAWEYTTITPCTYSLSPSGQSFGAQGGLGSFAVNTGPTCSWNPLPSGNWITILPSGSKGTGKVNYVVAANSAGVARNGFITVAGQQYNISESGFSCSYSIAPAVAAFAANGGDSRVVVTAPAGCSWTATSNAGWLSVSSGASGTGNAAVIVHATANAGSARSGTVTIAGTTFSVTQTAPGASACGALDVTAQLPPSFGGFTPSFGGVTTPVSITNHTSAFIPGPIYLVTVGEPTHYGDLRDTFLLSANPGMTTCFSTHGDYLILMAPGGLAPNQTASIPFGGLYWNAYPSYAPKVLSGAPSH